MGIDTYQEPVIFMRRDCHVCRSEGFEVQSRVRIQNDGHAIVATLNVVGPELLEQGDVGLSESAWKMLGAQSGETVRLSHPKQLRSLSHVRSKVYGHELSGASIREIIGDVAAGRYSDVQLSSFVTACAANRMSMSEIIHLTESMIDVGDRIDWGHSPVVDKHCVGGLPGNRTTLLIVPIVTAHGLIMPKTSSRAITSPAGTADAMETIAPVSLDIDAIRDVVDKEGGCIVWGGAVRLSPADDILIRVERVLDLDSEGQLIASVLSKKAAAGSTMVVIDIPVGPTAKVRDERAAIMLQESLIEVGKAIGLEVSVIITDGSQPIGRGIGPALEARDVLAVLRDESDAPQDLREKSLSLAGRILEVAGAASPGSGERMAEATLADGTAWKKFRAICEAQGGFSEPPEASHTQAVTADRAGVVSSIDNRRLSRIAKLAGAPQDPAAGIYMHVALGAHVEKDQPLFTIHAESGGELHYASQYVYQGPHIVTVESE